MKKVSILFCLFLVSNLYGFTQVKISMGETYKVDKDSRMRARIYKDSEGLVVKENYKTGITLEKFDLKNLKLTATQNYGGFPKFMDNVTIIECGGKTFLFYSLKDKETKLLSIYSREIDFEKGVLIGNDKLFYQFETEITNFVFRVSQDQKKFLLKYRVKPKIRNDNKNYDLLGLNVYDNTLKPVWAKEVSMPYTEKKMDIFDYTLDSQGNISLLTRIYDDNTTDIKREEDGLPNYHIEVLKIEGASNEIKTSAFELEDKFIRSIWIFEGPGDNLTSAGFFNMGINYGDANSIFTFKVGPQGKLSNIITHEIPLEVLNMYTNEKTQIKNEKEEDRGVAEMKNMMLKEIHYDESGGLILIGEQYYCDVIATGDKYNPYKHIYYQDNLLVTKLDSSGKLQWMQKIPHKQVSNYLPLTSYKYIGNKNSHYFILPDTEKNLNLPLNQAPAKIKNGKNEILIAYKIDQQSGKYEQFFILDPEDINGSKVKNIYTGSIEQTNTNEFIITAETAKNEQALIRVILP